MPFKIHSSSCSSSNEIHSPELTGDAQPDMVPDSTKLPTPPFCSASGHPKSLFNHSSALAAEKELKVVEGLGRETGFVSGKLCQASYSEVERGTIKKYQSCFYWGLIYSPGK